MKLRPYFLFPAVLTMLICIALPATPVISSSTCVSSPPLLAGRVLTDGEIIVTHDSKNQLEGFKYYSSSPTSASLNHFSAGNRNLELYDEIVAADLDGRGLDELIIGDCSDDRIHIYNADLEQRSSFDVDFERYDDLTVGDVNGDGNKEIILGDASDPRGRGIRVFTSSGREIAWYSVPGGYERYDRITAGDVDGDGRDEIIFGDASTGDDSIHVIHWSESSVGKLTAEETFYVNYDRRDEIAAADIDGDGIAEIILGCGAQNPPTLHGRIAVFDLDGNQLAQSADISFSGYDALAAGDLDMDGKAEIVVGRAQDGTLHTFKVGLDGKFVETASTAGYYYSPLIFSDWNELFDDNKITIGDMDGGSLTVGEPICRGQSELDDQVIAVINAPPKHDGVNNEAGIFTVSYDHDQTTTMTNTLTAITGFTFSNKISAKFNIFVAKGKAALGAKVNYSHKDESQRKLSVKIGESMVADQGDRKYSITTTYDVFEYPILDDNGNHLVIDGQPQYLLVTTPVSIATPTLSYYSPEIHTTGDITSYPSRIADLTNFSFDPIYDTIFVVGSDPSSGYIKTSESGFNQSQASTELTVSFDFEASGFIFGGLDYNLSGTYSNQHIRTHTLAFEENTSLKIDYTGGITDQDKYYSAHAIAYYDSEDGHLVLDWLVPSYGSFYSPSGGGGNLPPFIIIPPFNLGNLWQIINISLPIPTGRNLWDYEDDGTTARHESPSTCRPLACRENSGQLNLILNLPSFDDPVDLYIIFYAPSVSTENFYQVTRNGTTLIEGPLTPWIKFSSGNLAETVISDIPLAALPAGDYYFYLLVAPAGQPPLQKYYLWTTFYSR